MADTKTIAEALVAFRKRAPRITRSTTGQIGRRSYKYTPLDEILAIVNPILAECKLTFFQHVGSDSVRTVLIHSSGETMEVETAFPDWAVAPSPERGGTGIQQAGSLHTYMRRYALMQALGIAPADEDDDGASAAPPKSPRKSDPAMEKAYQVRDAIRAAKTMAELDTVMKANNAYLADLKENHKATFDYLMAKHQQRADALQQEGEG